MKSIRYLKYFITTLLLICVTSLCGYANNNKSSIAILKSHNSSDYFTKEHLGDYGQYFNDVLNTMNNTNLKYEIINESEITNENILKKYKILIIPMAVKMEEKTLNNIKNFTQNNGKLIVSCPPITYTKTSEILANIVGVAIEKDFNLNYNSDINWNISNNNNQENTFPPSSNIMLIKTFDNTKTIASWDSIELNDIPAITLGKSGSYISWPWGSDGNLTFNANSIRTIIDSIIPNLTKVETVEITKEKYLDDTEEIENFQKAAVEALSSLVQTDLSLPIADIQKSIYLSEIHTALFKSYYKNNQHASALSEYNQAKKSIIKAYSKSIPSRTIESRALWLDRGTVVSVKEPAKMEELFNKISEAGINIVYLETINAGYPIYPSNILNQNPLTIGYDPLASAIKEAHKHNIELHAWTWIFAVGNTRHNPLINKPQNYPGPIISNDFYDGALLGPSGNMLPHNQPEYWLNPANPDAQNLILSTLKEIVTNYDVDGLQLDYIRYPFQNQRTAMGFDFVGRFLFEKETGHNLSQLNAETYTAWKNWKAEQVSKFVKKAAQTLKNLNPDLQISAAVYSGSKRRRMDAIQQDWELWVKEGWVDTLSPMSYANNKERLSELVDFVKEGSGNKALIYPGLSIRQLDTAGFLEQIDTVRNMGLIGNTIFAMAHLNKDKLKLLETGPYRNKPLIVPSRYPIKASSLLLENFLNKVNKYTIDGKIFAFSKDQETEVKKSANELYDIIKEVSNNPSTLKLNLALEKSNELSLLTKDWLSFESSVRPGKAKLLTDYLKQLTSILEYAKHKHETGFNLSKTTAINK